MVASRAISVASDVLVHILAVTYPNYAPQGWHLSFVMWGLLLMCAVLNTLLGRLMPALEVLIGLLHIIGFFAILIPLVYLAPKTNASSVFLKSWGHYDWHSVALASFISLQSACLSFFGKLTNALFETPFLTGLQDQVGLFMSVSS